MQEKTKRLNELNALMKVSKKDHTVLDTVPDENDTVSRPRQKAYER